AGAAERHRARPELANVPRDVRGAAGVIGLVDDVDDGNGRFGRDPRDLAPDKFVQHQVAHNQDAPGGKLFDERAQAARVGSAGAQRSSPSETLGRADGSGGPAAAELRAIRITESPGQGSRPSTRRHTQTVLSNSLSTVLLIRPEPRTRL